MALRLYKQIVMNSKKLEPQPSHAHAIKSVALLRYEVPVELLSIVLQDV